MSVIAHGVDIVVVARIEQMLARHGDHFLERVYTPAERAYCNAGRSSSIRLAGRFAAKEAVLKVLGTGWRGGIQWTDIETLPDELGKPVVTLTGLSAARAAVLGITKILLSLSHAGDYAVASAVGVRED